MITIQNFIDLLNSQAVRRYLIGVLVVEEQRRHPDGHLTPSGNNYKLHYKV